MDTERRIKRLENRLEHWESELQAQRDHINGLADRKQEAAKTERQHAYWEEYRELHLKRVARREQIVVEPIREEYRNLLGLDQ